MKLLIYLLLHETGYTISLTLMHLLTLSAYLVGDQDAFYAFMFFTIVSWSVIPSIARRYRRYAN